MHHNAATQPQHTDTQYIEALRTGDNAVVGELYERCRQALTRHLQDSAHIDASDRKELLQAAFLQLWQLASDGRLHATNGHVALTTRQATEAHIDSLVAYFLGIAANKCREETRFRARFETLDIEPPDEPIEDEEQTKQRIVSECIQRMPKRCREILTLFFYEQLSLSEILARRAADKGAPLSYDGLKTAKAKCLKQLMTHIKQACQQAGIHIDAEPRTKS